MWLKNNRNLFSHTLEARSLKPNCQLGYALYKSSRGESFLAFSSSCRHQVSLGFRCLTSISASAFTWFSSLLFFFCLLWRHVPLDLGLTWLIPDDIIWRSLPSLYLQRLYFQINSHSQVLSRHIIWGPLSNPPQLLIVQISFYWIFFKIPFKWAIHIVLNNMLSWYKNKQKKRH